MGLIKLLWVVSCFPGCRLSSAQPGFFKGHMNLIIERFAYSPMGAFGGARLGGASWYSVEKPWVNNAAQISCIPEGMYIATRYMSPTPGRGVVWQLNDVPGRSNIQIHAANRQQDVIGCIGLGTVLGAIDGEWAVLNSRTAMAEFTLATRDADQLRIEIRSYRAVMQ